MPDDKTQNLKSIGFKAEADIDARVLILGTLPGIESLKSNEYYAKKTNSFWRIMVNLIGASIDLTYENRLCLLNRKGIALWDVCHSAKRSGSLDSKILLSTVVPNDFRAFLHIHTQIQLI